VGNSASIFSCTRRQEREALQQAFYVGVGDFQAAQVQAAGDFWEVGGEFAAHVSDEGELGFVEAEEAGVHLGKEGLLF